MKTITVLARQFGLSRTTLLYYDRLKLLSPSYRTAADARLYSDDDARALARIVTYRRAGLALSTIKHLLAAAPERVNARLEERLGDIQLQIAALRAQQRFIVGMLKDAVLRGERPARTKAQWVALLRACAFTEDEMREWHAAMERDDPEGHARFLRRIRIPATAARRIRDESRRSAARVQPTPSASAASP